MADRSKGSTGSDNVRSRSNSRYDSPAAANPSKPTSVPKWIRRKGRQASRMAGIKDAGVFDKMKYWRFIGSYGERYYEAPSRVKELLPIKGRKFVAVVCYNGEVVVLENSSKGLPRVDWTAKVALAPPVPETAPTKIRHACYDSLHGAIFFTVGFDAVYYAKLAEMEIEARANKATRLNLLIGPGPVSGPSERVHGLAADAENSVLFVCNNTCVTAWSTSKLDQPKKLQEIIFSTHVTPTVNPYKVALHLDIRGSSKTLLAVADRRNSTLSQLKIKYSRSTMGFGNTNAVTYELISVLAVRGSDLGGISAPEGVHFDPAGNLFVADNKNQRIQVFPFAQDGSTALDGADDELIVQTDLLSMLKTIAVVTSSNDRPLILAGLCGPFGNFGARKIMRLSYE